MTVIAFDKLAYVDRLTSSGIAEKDARAHADGLDIALRETVATKADLKDLDVALRADLKAEITGVRNDLKAVEVSLKAEIKTTAAETKTDILRWMFTSQLAMAAVVLAGFKIFGH